MQKLYWILTENWYSPIYNSLDEEIETIDFVICQGNKDKALYWVFTKWDERGTIYSVRTSKNIIQFLKDRKYIVWVGGVEINDYLADIKTARDIVNEYENKWYTDVHLERVEK